MDMDMDGRGTDMKIKEKKNGFTFGKTEERKRNTIIETLLI